MSHDTHDVENLASPRRSATDRSAVSSPTDWASVRVGESRFQQVRRQLRVLQVQRATSGLRAA